MCNFINLNNNNDFIVSIEFYMPNYDPEKDERNRIFDTFMILGILVLGAGQFVFLSHSLLFPSTPFQVSSVIPYNYFTAIPIFFVNFNMVFLFTLNLYEHLLVYGYYQIFAIGTFLSADKNYDIVLLCKGS